MVHVNENNLFLKAQSTIHTYLIILLDTTSDVPRVYHTGYLLM